MMRRDRSLIFEQLQRATGNDRSWIVDHEPVAVPAAAGQVSPTSIAEAAGRAAALFESQGMTVGDRCVVWLDAPLDVLVAVAGLTALGAVPILISPRLDGETLAKVLAPLDGVDRVVTTRSRLDSWPASTAGPRIDDWSASCRDAAALPPRRAAVSLPPTAPYVVTHTSGTTGVPKLLQFTRGAADHNSYTQEVPARLLRVHRGYAAVAMSPVHFRAMVGVLAALRRKIPLIVLAGDDPASVGPVLRRWRPIYLETHPNTFMRWEGLAADGSLGSVRYFLSTFDVIHPGTVETLLDGSASRFALLFETYGQSEVSGIAIRPHVKGVTARLSELRGRRRLAGHPVGWTIPGHSRARIVDEDGAVVGPGVPGRIQVRSTGRFSTYLNRPEAARDNLMPDGWWDTGDYGKKDRLGRLTLMDRQVERMTAIPSAIAVEDVLLRRMPWLLEAVVLERLGEPVPVVGVRDGAFDEERWRAAVADLPVARSTPVVLDYDEFPRTATGKIQRARLSALLAERAAGPSPVAESPEVA